jgi:dynein heavy chain
LTLKLILKPNLWKNFFENPDATLIPKLNKPLRKLHLLTILKIFRLDKILSAVGNFINENMGIKFTTPPPFSLKHSYRDSSPRKPLILILSSGVDPLSSFFAFAKESNMAKRIYSLSLGQGQSEIAVKMIRDAITNGFWVILQNCHVSSLFLSELERIYAEV